MKKNFLKKLATTLALALVVTSVGPAATTSAAAGITGAPSTVYATKAYKLKLGANVKARWTSSDKSIATVGLTGGVLKANEPGKVTIKAKSKKTGKTYKKTYTVKQRATGVELGDDISLAVGDTKTLNAVLTPSTSTDAVRYFSDNKEVATVGMTGGVVTAKKAGEATITVYAKATAGTSRASKFNKVDTIKVKVGTFIENAVQQSVTKLDVTFNADMKDAKTADFAIVNDTTKAVVAVKGLAIDGKKVTVETFAKINDGKTYTVTYKDSSAQFVATENKVAALGFSTVTVPHDTATEIKVLLKDANGVVLSEQSYANLNDAKLEFNITTNAGYTTGSKLVLFKVGDTAKATATYHTYEYDNAGVEVGVIKAEATIVAVDKAGLVIKENKYTVSKDAPANWSTVEVNTKLAIEDFQRQIYVYMKNADDEVISSGYKLESSNNDILLVGDNGDLTAGVIAVSQGTAYVLVKDNDGNVKLSLPVTIVAKRKQAGLELGSKGLVVSNFASVIDTQSTTVKEVDQYGEKTNASAIEVVALSAPTDTIKTAANTPGNGYFSITAGKVTFNGTIGGASVKEGKYSYKITVGDYSQVVNVEIKKADTSKPVSYRLDISANSFANEFNSTDTVDKKVTIKVAKLQDGAVVGYATPTLIETKRGTDPAVNHALNQITTLDVVKHTASGTAITVVSRLLDGTYTVKVVVDNDNAGGTPVTLTSSFTITDAQASLSAERVDDTVDGDTLANVILEAYKFKYNNKDLEATGVVTGIADIEATNNIAMTKGNITSNITVGQLVPLGTVLVSGDVVHVKTITLYVEEVVGGVTYRVPVKVTVNQTLTIN